MKEKILLAIRNVIEPKNGEYRITVIVNYNNNEWNVKAVATPLPNQPAHVNVEVQMNGSRINPSIKSTEWVTDRQTLERAKRADCNDVILADAQGHLYEGTSSNFAVLNDAGQMITAPDGTVLTGTIMKVVEQCAQQMGITVIRDFPREDQLQSYRAAFITSTSRLLLPIQMVYKHDGTEVSFESSATPVINELQRRLIDALLLRSTPLN